jgi:hypothetical protein
MKTVTTAVYALLGFLAIAAGLVAYVRPAIALPADRVTGLTAHLTREVSSAFIFIGLMFFWCLRHHSQRRPVHLALLAFTVFFAGAHWPDSFGGRRELVSILINSVPVALLAITASFGRP